VAAWTGLISYDMRRHTMSIFILLALFSGLSSPLKLWEHGRKRIQKEGAVHLSMMHTAISSQASM